MQSPEGATQHGTIQFLSQFAQAPRCSPRPDVERPQATALLFRTGTLNTLPFLTSRSVRSPHSARQPQPKAHRHCTDSRLSTLGWTHKWFYVQIIDKFLCPARQREQLLSLLELDVLLACGKMMLTSSDVSSMSASLSRWELAEYISTGLVTIACIGEYIADFTDWFTGGNKERKERLTKTSTLLLIAALSAELLCVVRTNQLSGGVIDSLGNKATEADGKAQKALTDSGSALTQSGQALAASGAAKESADSAHGEADQALKGATVDAARVAALNGKLADRTLSDNQVKSIAAKLAKYAGQEYDIIPYWDSPESMTIANRVQLALLQGAHWKYSPPTAATNLMGGLVGIKVNIQPQADEQSLMAAKDLTLALQAAGLEAKEAFNNPKNPKSNKISLSVGAKR